MKTFTLPEYLATAVSEVQSLIANARFADVSLLVRVQDSKVVCIDTTITRKYRPNELVEKTGGSHEQRY
jgi:hypothetical protein